MLSSGDNVETKFAWSKVSFVIVKDSKVEKKVKYSVETYQTVHKKSNEMKCCIFFK